jgi:hypothetical protein
VLFGIFSGKKYSTPINQLALRVVGCWPRESFFDQMGTQIITPFDSSQGNGWAISKTQIAGPE